MTDTSDTSDPWDKPKCSQKTDYVSKIMQVFIDLKDDESFSNAIAAILAEVRREALNECLEICEYALTIRVAEQKIRALAKGEKCQEQ